MKDKKNKLEEDDVQFLVDLLLETNLSISAISRQLNVSVNEVNKKINQLGLSWLKESRLPRIVLKNDRTFLLFLTAKKPVLTPPKTSS